MSINIDVIGIGAGVVDRLKELGLPAHGVNVAESEAPNAEGESNSTGCGISCGVALPGMAGSQRLQAD